MTKLQALLARLEFEATVQVAWITAMHECCWEQRPMSLFNHPLLAGQRITLWDAVAQQHKIFINNGPGDINLTGPRHDNT